MVNEKQKSVLINKLSKIINIYGDFIIDNRLEMETYIAEPNELLYYPPENGYRLIKKAEKWGGDFRYGWFRCKINVPDCLQGRKLYIEKNTGGIEGLIFIDNKPCGMFDVVTDAKEEVFRLHKYVAVESYSNFINISIEDYSGHTFYGTMPFEKKQTFALNKYREKPFFEGIYLVTKREEAEQFINNLKLFLSYYAIVENAILKKELFEDLLLIYKTIDLMPQEEYDREKIVKANALFDSYKVKYKDKIKNLGNIRLIGHSHLDTAWLWTIDETKRKIARTVSNAVNLLKKYDCYKFIMSSVKHLQWLQEYYPTLFSDVIRLAKEDRFEINGATLIECDCNLTGGEALIRQFVYGQKYVKEHLNRYSDCFFLPDTFGYSAALPQIMQSCKVKYFYTTKLSWNDTNKFPYDTFVWEGLDKSKVITHFNTIQEFPNFECIKKRDTNILNREYNDKALIAYGYGDGGGGPDQAMVNNASEISKLYNENVRHTTISDFMEEIDSEKLPVYSGELYLELHRGTYTTNHKIKKLNRFSEIILHNLELMSVLFGKNYCELKLFADRQYDIMLVNQFHDILPGTCINEVNVKAISENEKVIKDCEDKINELSNSDEFNYFNCLSFKYDNYAVYDGYNQQADNFIDFDNKQKNIVRLNIDGFCTSQYGMQMTDGCFIFKDNKLETPLYSALFNSNNEIISLKAKNSGKEYVVKNGKLNNFVLYDDVPALWDNWNIDADYIEKVNFSGKLLQSEQILIGQGAFIVRNKYAVSKNSILTQDIIFYKDKMQIEFFNKLEWNDRHKLLKVYFDTNIFAEKYRSETQFGYIERNTEKNTSIEQAKYEVCNHKYTDISQKNMGFAVINDCKYGVSVDKNIIGLTLIKSGTHPDTTADRGTHYFNYGIVFYEGEFSFNNVIKPAYQFNYKPLKIKNKMSGFLKISDESVIIETVKIAENTKDIILRLYESEGIKKECILKLTEKYKIFITDMLENDIDRLSENSNELMLQFRPFEIKTIKLVKESK